MLYSLFRDIRLLLLHAVSSHFSFKKSSAILFLTLLVGGGTQEFVFLPSCEELLLLQGHTLRTTILQEYPKSQVSTGILSAEQLLCFGGKRD